jgi:hypothetical protein
MAFSWDLKSFLALVYLFKSIAYDPEVRDERCDSFGDIPWQG